MALLEVQNEWKAPFHCMNPHLGGRGGNFILKNVETPRHGPTHLITALI